MAQLKDTIVSGNLRVTDTTLTDTLRVTKIKAPTTSGGTTYGVGTNGQVLKSNGTMTYWADMPTIPTVNNASLTLKGAGTTVTTFTANASTNQSLDIVAGSNVTITPDATNHKITIASTTYSANNGVGLSGTTFYNSGVRAVSTGSANGTISVNTNGTSADVAVKGLASAAYVTQESLLRARSTVSTDGGATGWSQIGINQYNNAYPDGVTNKIYSWGAVVSIPAPNARFDLYYNHNSSTAGAITNGLQYRTGWDDDKKAWRMLLDSGNYTSYTVTKTGGGASGSWGISITGSAASWTTARTLTLSGQLTGSVSVKGDANMTLSGYLKNSFICDESEDFASYAWHKFAETTITDANGDQSITFIVSKTWGDVPRRSGILTAHIRTNATKVHDSSQFYWQLANTELDPEDFVFVYTNTANTSCKVELWYKQTNRYDGWVFSVLKEHSRTSKNNVWTLYTSTGHGSASHTAGTDSYASSIAGIKNNTSGTSSNVTGTVAIAHGGTGATTRLAALRALTEQDVGTSAQYFLTITNSWGKGGYTSVANAKTVLGLKSAAYTESSDYVPNTQAGVIDAINLLSTGSSTPSLADYYVSQYANGGTTSTSYHRRPISSLWNAFKELITLTTTTGSGNAVTDVSIANDGDHNRKITVTKGSTFSLSTHTHGLLHSNLNQTATNGTTGGWSVIGIDPAVTGYVLKSIRVNTTSPDWLSGDYGAGIAFGGSDTKGVISMSYQSPPVITFAGGNHNSSKTEPTWYLKISGTSGSTYNLANFYDSTISRTANTVLAAPNGSNGGATFRKLVAADLTGINYAGSSSAGGAATSANKLNTDAGGTYLPVYFNNGVPEAVTVKNNTSKGTIGWTSGAAANAALVTVNSIAYWNGAYSGTSSNLAYCNKGEFGSIVTKSTTDYSKVSFSRNLTSGTKVGTITIDGTSTDLYCQTNTNTTYSAGTGLSLSGTTFNHSNSVTSVANYNKPYVKYDAQGHITGSSYWTATAVGTGGEGGWIKVATIVHTDIHDDTPIMLLVSQRGNTITYKLHIVWKNTSNTDPDINKFKLSSDIDTNADAYIKKSTTSTWELYIKKLDNWDAIAMHLYVGKYFPDHMTWTWQDVQTAESAITGGIKAEKIVLYGHLDRAFIYDDNAVPSGHTWAEYAWHKFAEVTITDTWADCVITFLVSRTYGDSAENAGILSAKLRTNGSKAYDSAQLKWLVRNSGLSKDDFVMVYTSTSGTNTKAELWCRLPYQYSGLIFTVLKEHRRHYSTDASWTLVKTPDGTGSTHGSSSYPTTGIVDKIISSDGTITNSTTGNATTATTATYVNGTLTNPTDPIEYSVPFHTYPTTGSKSLLNNDGISYVCREGTADNLGFGVLVLGNGVNSGTAGNKYGIVRMYPQTGKYYGQIRPVTTLTGSRTYQLPNASGNVILGIKDSGFWGLMDGDGSTSNWIRATSNGLIPSAEARFFQTATSSLGTNTWYFKHSYIQNMTANTLVLGAAKTTDGAAKGQVKFFSGNPNDATGTVTLECINDSTRTGDYTVKLPTWNGTIPVFEKLFEGALQSVSLSYSDINEYDLFLITVANSNATSEQVTVTSLWVSNIAGVHDMPLIWGGAPTSSGGACNVTSGWIQLSKSSGTITFNIGHKSNVAQMTSSGWSISSPTYNLYIRKIFGLKTYKRT